MFLKCYWELLIVVKIKLVNLYVKYDISYWLILVIDGSNISECDF